jgi:hypothetical protein
VKLIEFGAQYFDLSFEWEKGERKKEIDCVLCGAGDRKSQEFMDGCKLTVIMLK